MQIVCAGTITFPLIETPALPAGYRSGRTARAYAQDGKRGGGCRDGFARPISLQQARAMFDPGKFFGMLRGAWVRGV